MTLQVLFWLAAGACVLVLWAIVEAFGWLIDQLSAYRPEEGPCYADPRETDRRLGWVEDWPSHDAAAIRGSRQRGLDVTEGLSDHAARRSRPSESLLGTRESGLSTNDADRGTGQHDRRDGYGHTIQFPAAPAQKSVN